MQPVLTIRETDEGKRELVPMRWGLVPAWSKGPDRRYSMINARAESEPLLRIGDDDTDENSHERSNLAE